MTTIEQSTPREVRALIREQLAKMPATVDANGWLPGETHMGDPSEHPAPGDVLQPVEPESNDSPGRPLPDQSQGYQGVPTPRPPTLHERLRAQLAKLDH
jgi:hypothetical protein